MTVLAMNRNKVFRLEQCDQLDQFILIGMAGDMNGRDRFVEKLGAPFVELIDQRINRALVAGDEARRKHDRVARLDTRARMSVGGYPYQRGKRLALAAAGKKCQFSRFKELRLGRIDISARCEWELAQFQSQAHALGHPASQWHHAPTHLARDL